MGTDLCDRSVTGLAGFIAAVLLYEVVGWLIGYKSKLMILGINPFPLPSEESPLSFVFVRLFAALA